MDNKVNTEIGAKNQYFLMRNRIVNLLLSVLKKTNKQTKNLYCTKPNVKMINCSVVHFSFVLTGFCYGDFGKHQKTALFVIIYIYIFFTSVQLHVS